MSGSHPIHPSDAGGPIPLPSAMPPELVETSRLMDALGECDRASAPAGLEGRLMFSLSKVLPASPMQATADVADATQRMERLAQADQAAASRTLEDRIFMATRGVLAQNAVKLDEPSIRTRSVGWFASGGFAMRAAAGLLLGGGVIWGYLTLRPADSEKISFMDPELAVAKLEKEIDGHLDELGDVFALAMIGATPETSVPTEEPIESGDTWFQYDFLQSGDSI